MLKRHTVRDFSKRSVDFAIIQKAIQIAGSAPSGANLQQWHFVAISNKDINKTKRSLLENTYLKKTIRDAAEIEEKKFYSGSASDEWIKALEPIGTNANKPHLEIAPWLIIIFAERFGTFDDGSYF